MNTLNVQGTISVFMGFGAGELVPETQQYADATNTLYFVRNGTKPRPFGEVCLVKRTRSLLEIIFRREFTIDATEKIVRQTERTRAIRTVGLAVFGTKKGRPPFEQVRRANVACRKIVK